MLLINQKMWTSVNEIKKGSHFLWVIIYLLLFIWLINYTLIFQNQIIFHPRFIRAQNIEEINRGKQGDKSNIFDRWIFNFMS